MEKNNKTVAAATKKETANAATSAAKTATTSSTAAGLKPAAEKPETPKAEAKPAAPAATPAPTKTETPKTAEPTKQETPKQAEPAKTETKTEQPAAPAAQEDENAAKVAAFAAELKRKQSLAEMQRQINEELQRLNHKKEVADKRNVFLTCSGKMDEYLKLLKEEGEFETNLCRLSFEIFEKDSYGRENFKDFMTVSNTAIVTKFCNVLKEEIAAKVAELETELLKA
ncbi:MAG: hypothetical protein IKN98_01135 [Bacteroidales bacterium]|nr:hypothetical protein [Bacteroidales bacterium]